LSSVKIFPSICAWLLSCYCFSTFVANEDEYIKSKPRSSSHFITVKWHLLSLIVFNILFNLSVTCWWIKDYDTISKEAYIHQRMVTLYPCTSLTLAYTQDFVLGVHKFNYGAGVSHITYLVDCHTWCPVHFHDNVGV